jgi:glycosyltransferase involved in cell wall biosynthesis
MAKVLVIAPYVPHPPRHGGAIRSRLLLDALRSDHEVHLAAAVGGPEDRGELQALAAATGIVGHELPARGHGRSSPWRKLGSWLTGRSELLGRRWAPGARAVVEQICERQQFARTVVDSTWSLPAWPGVGRAVLFLHNLEHSLFDRRGDVAPGLSARVSRHCEARALRREERAALERIGSAVVVSERDRDLALALAPAAQISVVPNTVDLAALPLQPSPPPPAPGAPVRLLFVGSFDYPPNLAAVTELVAQHLPTLRAAFPELCVRLVGRDPVGIGARFRGLPGVEWVGTVDDVVPHYRGVHAVYLPIRSGGGTRIKILEAWALGVPVLATAVAAEGLPARDGEHLLRFETPADGLEALRRVLTDGATLRANGRELVAARFAHDVARRQLRELFAGLMRG